MWTEARTLGTQELREVKEFFGFRAALISFPYKSETLLPPAPVCSSVFLGGGENKAAPATYVCVSFLIGLGFSNRPAGCLGKNEELSTRCLRWSEFCCSAKDLEGAACASTAVMGTQALG